MDECSEKARIAEIERRLGSGDVTLATMDEKLSKVLEQTQKTNGRVSRLERCRNFAVNTSIGIVIGMLIYGLGFFEFVKEIL